MPKPMGKMRGMKMGPVKKGTFKRLMKYLNHFYGGRMVIVVICIIINSLSLVVSTIVLQRLIDNVITPGIELGFAAINAELWKYLVIMIISYSFGVVASFIYTRIMAMITHGTLFHFRQDMFSKMETLPIKYYDTNSHGDIMSTYTNDTDAIRQLIGQSLPTIVQTVMSIIGVVFMMIYYSLWLTLVVIAIIVIMLVVSKKIAGGSAKYMILQQKSLATEEGYIEELINGQKVVKVFNYEARGKETFDKYNEKLYQDSKTAHTYGGVLFPILGNMGNIMYVIVAFVGGILVINGTKNISISEIGIISLGIIVAFLSLTRYISKNIGQASNQVTMVAMGLAGAGRIFDLLDQEPEADEGYVTLVHVTYDENGNVTETKENTNQWCWRYYHKSTDEVTYTELKGALELEHVNFAYTEGNDVLHDVSFYANPGQKIALVGATGAGKTTITNLINRFYDISDGKIRYDGINIEKICKDDLRKSLGVVLQDVNLFTGTVMENIRYGRLEATDDECIEAAKLANADDFITRLPSGYNTMLKGNGASLSQGQRQLISIARVAVANTPAMILDEATSSIDTRTEALVQAGMDNLMKGRTVFVIAHRLSTVRDSNAIMVLDHGRIIERGSHEQLIAKKGVYYQLYTGAFELE
ncbi:MAG: ABC transporter ATP-binding protein [Bacilli bacterium]